MPTRIALALDLGGTKLDAALVDADGSVLTASRNRRATGRAATPADLDAAIEHTVAHALSHLPRDAEFAGVGIGSAGPIDLAAGAIHPVNMPGLHGYGLADAAHRSAARALRHDDFPTRLRHDDFPTRLRHDGGCLALAESWIGAAAGSRASLSIVVSTGVGGGIVVDGEPIGGASGNAGHLGQTVIGDLTLEEIASGPASVAWARSQGWNGETGEDIARDAASGDVVARAAIERSAATVGLGLANASTLLDLDVIAISGGFSRVAPDYVDLVSAALVRTAVLPYARATRVVRSALGDEGPLVGAAALVLR
ncbi:ROK family protein [Microbacterium marinilacus]|uniref:ROK family protein n=1 Tax=Microbacterium marinilacus TaxID=415209 RepID=A0ABP7BKY6_9MICO|nr:ROK family protein [Microbacterium marinilacus]MBY0689682.1 ROK family protein [Microbacterium marinilacus]